MDWHPWDDKALALAKKENKPIFLSIGYSTCHWCHVMAHESFEDPAVAAIMNKHFVNIKVDREERPDLDAIYMTAVQLLTGAGGWPMSVWLTPDLKPFYGGTYFAPDDRYGRPAFTTVLTQLAEIWEKERERVVESSVQITQALTQATLHFQDTASLPSLKTASEKTLAQLSAMYDPMYGGFGRAPKFPMPTYLVFLLDLYRRTKNKDALNMVSHTLTNMVSGGLYDQLGGGFARYSTDERWIVPHFEKMLYDNSQLVSVLAKLAQENPAPLFKDALQETVAYLARDLAHPEGGFYSAEDADSEGKEGTFYLWTLAEMKKISGSAYYGVTANGNFTDPHTREPGQNVLTRAGELPDQKIKQKLFETRAKRPRPHRDDKVLTEWNGLMISALVHAGLSPEAEKTARFIEKNLYDTRVGVIFRRWRDGERKIEGHQTDYAFLIQGLLDLFEATGTVHWLEWALALHQKQNDLFWDTKSGGYFAALERSDLLLRIKDDTDNVTPSGNSIAALNGFRLGTLLKQNDFTQKAEATLKAFAKTLSDYPASLTSMISALSFLEQGPSQIVIIGDLKEVDTQKMLEAARRHRSPGTVVLPLDPLVNQKKLATIAPAVAAFAMVEGQATAYLCANYSCQKPTTDPQQLKEQLEKMGNG